MKTETLADVKNNFSQVIDSLGREPVFITRNGRIAAVLQAMTDEGVEDYLTRNSSAFWKLVEARRASSNSAVSFDPTRYGAAVVCEKKARYTVREKRKSKVGKSM